MNEMEIIMNEQISLIGLGKLGLPMAVCYADAGIDVLGVDVQKEVVDAVNQGRSPIVEPGLNALVSKHSGTRLRATINAVKAIEETDTTIVLVATPSLANGLFSNEHVESALISLGTALRDSTKDYHLFVISSTVVPESIQGFFIPLLEKYSGRRLNEGFGVGFLPDFVALGSVIRDFKNPDLILIGESDPEVGAKIESLHLKICENHPPVFHMSLVNAEMAKVCLNAYITLKVSFANSVANLCERVPGGDVDAITRAIGADKRISPYYLSGGLSFGGTCFPRDVTAYKSISDSYGLRPELMDAIDKVNTYQDDNLLRVVMSAVEKQNVPIVGILGLAFKDNTPVITESPGIKLIEGLMRNNIKIIGYDSLAMDVAKEKFGDKIAWADTAEACIQQANICVLTYRSKLFVAAVESYAPAHRLAVIDCWRQLTPDCIHTNIAIIPIGKHTVSN